MDYPTSITIKGHIYRIEYVATSQEVEDDFAEGLWLGQCCNDVIRVLASQEPFAVLDTLIHEILHAIFNRNKMLKAALQSADMEEPFIDTLAAELAVVLDDTGFTASLEKPSITERIVHEDK